jgi:FkbM family methyltransferase
MVAGVVQNFFQGFGYELSRTPSAQGFLSSRNVDLVLDVGANLGQYARGLRGHGYKGRIHSFEPIKVVYEKLAASAAGDALWDVSNRAVGAAPGRADINVSDYTVYSSMRPTTELGTSFSRHAGVVRTESVEVVTLDSYDVGTAQAVFLKIDTQGYEREVLAGAGDLLKRCVGLQLELPIEHLYKDVWSFNEALAYVDNLGLVPAQVRMVNALHDDKASALEFDVIFRRKR